MLTPFVVRSATAVSAASGTHDADEHKGTTDAAQERANLGRSLGPGGFGPCAGVGYHFRSSDPIRRQCPRGRYARMAAPPGAVAAGRLAQRVLSPGRFAAEWFTRRARVRRKSLLLRRRI